MYVFYTDCPDKRDKAEARQEKGDAGGGVAKDVVEQGEKGLPVPDPEPSQNVAGPAPQLALQTEKQTTECTVNEGEFTEVKSKKRNKSAAGLSDSVLERSPRAVCREVAELDTASSSKVVEHGGDLQTPLADGPESGPAAVLTCLEEKRESSLTAELPVPDSAEGMEQFVAAERIGEELKQVGVSEAEENEEMYETEDGELSDSSVSTDIFSCQPASRKKLYSIEKINSFLDLTKNKKGVEVKHYFPDLKLFLYSVQMAFKKATLVELSQQKRFRLKKMVQNVKKIVGKRLKKTI
ncbi:UNVERIFIED_CONTAM: hypothetical protein FKN15_058750 [Acipenser sinensis]